MTPEGPTRGPLDASKRSDKDATASDPWADLQLPAVDRDRLQSEAASLQMETCLVREVFIQYRGRALRAPAQISTPRDAADLARRIVKDHAREHFVVLYLDGRHQLVAHSVVSVGSANASLVHPREVFQSAVLLGAIAVILPSTQSSVWCFDAEL